MKKTLFLVVLFALSLPSMAQREKIRLDEGWCFHFGNAADPTKDFGCGTEYFNYLTKAASIHNEGPYAPDFDDSDWTEVRVPHDWVTTLPYSSEASHSHGYKTVGYKYPDTSVGWYRREITIPTSDLSRHISLQFDGIFRDAQVWFNGIFMGQEPSGYATQVYDVTEYANYGGRNVVCVRADASLEEGWFYEGAGIYRDVWLMKDEPLHVAPFGTFVHADLSSDFSHAQITVETTIENTAVSPLVGTIRTSLLDAEGSTVARAEEKNFQLKAKDKTLIADITMELDNPQLWDTEHPYLYTVVSEVVLDGLVVDTYTTRTGIRRVEFTAEDGFFLNGQHVKLRGANLHQDHAGVGSAMPEGLMRWRIRQLKEMGCNAYRASHNPMTPAQLDICDEEGLLVIDENRLMGINDYHRRLLENFIVRDRNHPSIILWSDGNEEWGLEKTITGTRIAEAMREMTRRLDPTRPSCVANAGGDELIKGLDVVGYNYIVQNDVLRRRELHPEWKIVGTEETTGCGTRGVYFPTDKFQMASLNRTDSIPPIERGWQFYRDTPWAAGCFFWTGLDYRGEPNPLSFPAHDSEFGLMDYCGFWKDEAYYLHAAWTDTPTLHILPHWNLSGHEGEVIDLWVYSNCDEVALSVNGKNLGRQAMPRDGHLSWQAVYAPGRVVATGYVSGEKVLTETIETTSEATQIEAMADRQTLTADGADVAIVNLSLKDKKGRIVPTACSDLTFTLNGEGRIIGAGNGDPACLVIDHPIDIDCREFSFPAFNGRAQVIIQTTHTSGDILLTCSGEGLKDGTLTLTTQQ